MADRKTCIFDMKTWRTGIFDMKTWRTCIFDMKTWRTGFHSVAEKEQRKRIATCWMRATSCRNKPRRLWCLAVAPHPRTQADWVWAAGSAERDLYNETHCKLRSSAAVGTYAPKMSSLKGDLCFPYIVEDDSRSRFAEPRDGEVMLIPQLRSFGVCSGFLIDTCPFWTRRWLMICYWRLRGYGETP